MEALEKLESFGKEIIENLRDASIEEYLAIKKGEMKSVDAQNIFKTYISIDTAYHDKVDVIVLNIIDRVLHNALWMFEQSKAFTIGEKSLIDPNKDIVEISDGLSGELYSEDGWIEKYSKFPSGTIH
ncbi:hypothetical protein [Mucilaginibacter paludis]|uniref:Uncharacterized protein n=1 Tax=Mucilaginibacter paludis DSM 18603 TaxID=714943 RepID=H1YER9_9SPHI|nr:hypothetical protein [Mucilaginibacter paludis]EHQ24336.1 hypothetical protein Mucpa_0136 [Mucilaginibacter paludis DSM 18603]